MAECDLAVFEMLTHWRCCKHFLSFTVLIDLCLRLHAQSKSFIAVILSVFNLVSRVALCTRVLIDSIAKVLSHRSFVVNMYFQQYRSAGLSLHIPDTTIGSYLGLPLSPPSPTPPPQDEYIPGYEAITTIASQQWTRPTTQVGRWKYTIVHVPNEICDVGLGLSH